MSRCFPYPPPGFTKKASDVATLIYSIKLQKENKANKEKRKEKRRDKGEKDKKEKKDKKREKKEKKELVDSKQTKVGNEGQKDCKIWTESKGLLSQKRKLEETEQLEGSSVTEEHGQPLNQQNPSYSSDGTQNSNKRRKQASVASDIGGNGNIVRIKLPLHKHKESESTVSKEQLHSTEARNVQNRESNVKATEEQQCSTSGRNEKHNGQIRTGTGLTGLFVHPGEDVSRGSQGATASLSSFRKPNSLLSFSCPSNEFCSTSGNTNKLPQGHPQTSVSVPVSCSTPLDKKMQKKVSKYDSLIQNLYEMAVPSEVVDDDGEDWLFGGKRSDTVVKKKNVDNQLLVNGGVTCSGSSTLYPLYPRARYLEEAKIYALPYTVPF